MAGVYAGFIDTVPIGAAFNKGLTIKMGQTHVHKKYEAIVRNDRKRPDRFIICGDARPPTRRRAGCL